MYESKVKDKEKTDRKTDVPKTIYLGSLLSGDVGRSISVIISFLRITNTRFYWPGISNLTVNI